MLGLRRDVIIKLHIHTYIHTYIHMCCGIYRNQFSLMIGLPTDPFFDSEDLLKILKVGIHTNIHTLMDPHPFKYTYIHTYIHTYVHTVHIYIHTDVLNAITHIDIGPVFSIAWHIKVLIHIHTYIHTYIHTSPCGTRSCMRH